MPLFGTKTGGIGRLIVGPGSPRGGANTDRCFTFLYVLLIPSLRTRSPASTASSIREFLMVAAYSDIRNLTISSRDAPYSGGVSRSINATVSVLTLFKAELIITLNL